MREQEPGFFLETKLTMNPGECFEKVQSSFGLHRVWDEHLKKRDN